MKATETGAVLMFALILLMLSALSVNALLQQVLTAEKRIQMNRFWLRAEEVLDNEIILQLHSIEQQAANLWVQLQPLQTLQSTAPQPIQRHSIQNPDYATLEVQLNRATGRCSSLAVAVRVRYVCLQLTIQYLSAHEPYNNPLSTQIYFALIQTASDYVIQTAYADSFID